MASERTAPRINNEIWELVRRQHGVIARAQLLELGVATGSIAHRLRSGRLHRVQRGVYAVGRPDLSRSGQWMAAVLSCGPAAVLSHRAAAALHGIVESGPERAIEVTVPPATVRARPGLRVYRRTIETTERAAVDGVPVTTAERVLLDLAPLLSRRRLEAAVNAADKHDLVDPEALRDSLVRYAGLGQPRTSEWVNGFEVDFHWPELGLVVETDGLRYHRTPATQARDRLRDHGRRPDDASLHACPGALRASARARHAHRRRPGRVDASVGRPGGRTAWAPRRPRPRPRRRRARAWCARSCRCRRTA